MQRRIAAAVAALLVAGTGGLVADPASAGGDGGPGHGGGLGHLREVTVIGHRGASG